ncbi:MAG: type II toxin-antitoxin system Phd/YefM family antitoxin [Egibacteraceae bacterium]
MDVGVRELKQHLSEYLERAARGEIIQITDRGRPKAILAPLPGRLRLREGIEEGWVRPPLTDQPPQPARRFKIDRSIAELIDEDRGP